MITWYGSRRSLTLLLYGVGSGMFNLCYSAVQATLIRSEERYAATSAFQVGNGLTMLLTPTLAGWLFTLGRSLTLFLNATTYVGSLLTLARLRKDPPPFRHLLQPRSNFWLELVDGMRYVFQRRWLWVAIAATMFINVGISTISGLALPWIVTHQMHLSAMYYGFAMSAMTLGSVVASYFLGGIKKLVHPGRMSYAAMTVTALIIAVAAVAHTFAILLGALVAFGGANAALSLIWSVTLQETIPSEKFGRVAGLDMFLSSLSLPVCLPLVGWLSSVFGVVDATGLLGLGVLVVALLGGALGANAWDTQYHLAGNATSTRNGGTAL
ncbi:MAG: MFS transporter [Thermaerobacter sp.]|nr:MFS transporter [Thermaerobacter sp.]